MSQLKTVSIKGSQYVTVNERLKYFRDTFAGYSLESELIAINDETALVRAIIRNDQGTLVATGTAYERRDDKASFVNKTSHVENAETSAWGRALANFGIGIDANVASADELVLALNSRASTNDAASDLVEIEPGEWVHRDELPKKKREDVDKAHTGVVMEIHKLCLETKADPKKLYAAFGAGDVPTKEQGEQMLAHLKKRLSDQLDKAASQSAA